MAEDYTNINEGAYIIAESMIESAKVYAETLRHAADEIEQLFLQTKKESIEAIRELEAIKKRFEEQKKKYEDELAVLNATIKQKTEEKMPETPAAPATPVVKYKSLVEEIHIVSEEQKQAKKERNMKKFTGTRKYATERMAQIAVSGYSRELRAMWAALAWVRGISFNKIEMDPGKEDPHPLYRIIDKINEYMEKYGYESIKSPEPVQEQKPVQNPKAVTYGVRIESGTNNKLELVKIYKEISGLGLKEAKETIDRIPVIIPNGLRKEEAERIVSGFVNKGYQASIIIADA